MKRGITGSGKLGKHLIAMGMSLLLFFIFAMPLLAQQRTGTIGSGGTGGSWFTYATGFAEYLRTHSDIRLTVVPASGGLEGFRNVLVHKVDFGFTQNSVAEQGWEGLPPFKAKNQDFRSIGVVSPATVSHFVVLKKSTIRSVYDLQGKTFSPGPIGTNMYLAATTFLKDLGIFDKIKIVNITHSEQQEALADGKIDGYAIYVTPPGGSVSEMAVKKEIRLIDFKEVIEKFDFFKKYSWFTPQTIPANTYKGVDYAISTWGDMEFLVVNKAVDEKMVYDATKLWFSPEGVNFLKVVHKSLGEMGKKDPTDGLVTPLHPGAEKVWRERGITIRKFK